MRVKNPSKTVRGTHFKWVLRQRNGIWQADGRSKQINAGRHSLGVANYDEALAELVLLDRLRAEELGLIPKSSAASDSNVKLPISEGLELYNVHIARHRILGGLKRSTIRRKKSILERFTKFCVRQNLRSWDQIGKHQLTLYVTELTKKKFSPESIATELNVVKAVFNWLREEGHLGDQRPLKLKVKRFDSTTRYCYTREEVVAMIGHCRALPGLNWLADIIVGLATTGMRSSELAALRLEDIDWSQNVIMLADESAQAVAGQATGRELKSGCSRQIPIHPPLRAILEQHRDRAGYVFLGPRGGRIKLSRLREVFKAEVIQPLSERFPAKNGGKGLADGVLHSFRHYFCSTCANEGGPERLTMAWLGHRSSAMIRRYYHVADSHAQRIMQEMNFLGTTGGCSVSDAEGNNEAELAAPAPREENSSNKP